jgi:hypothetical protein
VTQQDDIQRLLAESKIRNAVNRYAHAVDRGDATMLCSVFWEDGRYVGKLSLSDEPVHKTVQLPLEFLKRFFLFTQHRMVNTVVDFTGDNRANVATYFSAYHLVRPEPEVLNQVFGPERLREIGDTHGRGHDIDIGGRYYDVFEGRGGDWRILTRELRFDWIRTFGGSAPRPGESVFQVTD